MAAFEDGVPGTNAADWTPGNPTQTLPLPLLTDNVEVQGPRTLR